MHSAEEERYVFLRFADSDICQALMALDRLSSAEDDFIRNCLLRDAAVAYIRPFKTCRMLLTKQTLDSRYVPRQSDLRALHKELDHLRDEVFTHTDLTVRSPVLHCWTAGWTRGTQPSFPIQFKGHTYPTLIKRVDDLRHLFETVLAKVRADQAELEAKLISGVFR